jgi:hypothetical protein
MADPIVADAKAEVSKVTTFVKANWGHFVTWITLWFGSVLAKHIGL